MNHLDYCTHIKYEADRDILTRPNFDVNIRLFNANVNYRNIILDCVEYIRKSAILDKVGYKKPHGWSGANAGIPFNIIAVGNDFESADIMINPRITRKSGILKAVKSNCGSLTLENPIKIWRDILISVSYFNENGEYISKGNIGPNPGFTIQHEVEHTQGILLRSQS